MAYLYVRRNGRVEIREAHSTPRGPRSRTLVSFKGPLSEEHLDRAELAATRGFARAALCRRAEELGVRVERASADSCAHALIAGLRSGARLDPVLVGLLRTRLDELPAAPAPDDVGDVVEWLGASDHERGRALRDVLRLYDQIARSREPVDEPAQRLSPGFPRFAVRAERRAS
jgi:hypothetical protein